MQNIGVFPASGGLGGSTYKHLLNFVPHNHVTLISRDPFKVPSSYTTSGVTTRKASYESTPAELEAAFRGIDVLFLISYPAHVHEYRVKVQFPAIDAARRAGVHHIFYSSLGYARERDTESAAVVMHAHLDTEKYLAFISKNEPSFSYTAIREGLYSESFTIYTSFFDPAKPGDGVIRIPHDGSAPGIAWAKRDELGEASARLISDYAAKPDGFRYENDIVLLTGQKVWTLNETAKALGEVAGRKVRIEKVSVDEYVKLPRNLDKFGGDESMVRSWSSAFEGIQKGECAVVSPALKEILGREPEAFDVTLKGGREFQSHG